MDVRSTSFWFSKGLFIEQFLRVISVIETYVYARFKYIFRYRYIYIVFLYYFSLFHIKYLIYFPNNNLGFLLLPIPFFSPSVFYI